jgi:aryl-alcohol dehydrogenase-like predicted oxidoreductase
LKPPPGSIELNTTVSALALVRVAKNLNASTIILGASNSEQVTQNLKAIPKLTPEVLQKIEKILENLQACLEEYKR